MADFDDNDFAAMREAMKAEAAEGSYKSLYWKPTKEGTTAIRIMPYSKNFGEKLFFQHHKLHYINNKGYFCLSQTLTDANGNVHTSEPCPLCQKSKQLYNLAGPNGKGTEEWNVAGQLRAKDRYVSRVVVRGRKSDDGKDVEAEPVFWEFGKKLYTYFANQIELGECGNFLSLKADGRDFNLSKVGAGRDTDYSASSLSMKNSQVFNDVEKIKTLKAKLESDEMRYSKLVTFESVDTLKQVLKEFLQADDGQTPEQVFMSGAPSASVSTELDTSMANAGIPGFDAAPAAENAPDDIDALLDSI